MEALKKKWKNQGKSLE